MRRILVLSILVPLAHASAVPAHAGAEPTIFDLIESKDAAAAIALATRDRASLEVRNAAHATPILWALYHELPELAQGLAAHKRRLDFFEAVALGRVDEVDAGLSSDPGRLDRPAPDGFRPLGLAVFFRQDEVARLLLKRGAAVDAVSDNAQRVGAVHAAVARENVAMLADLLARGANPDLTQARLFRPIHESALAGNAALVALLVWYGADPCAKTEKGETAAMLARGRGHTKLASRLTETCAKR